MINTNLPLPPKKIRKTKENGNQGLYFNKFFNQWTSNDFNKIEAGNKSKWLDEFAGKKICNAFDMANHKAERIKNITKSLEGKTKIFATVSPFVTGMGLSNPVENGFLWHHTLGVPYLPGSSIKGMIRAWAESWAGANNYDVNRLFGSEKDGAGSIIVFDALPVKPVDLYVEVITPHDGGWRISSDPKKSPPADWISPNPIPFLAVKEGAEFQFALAPRSSGTDKSDAGKSDIDTAYEYLECALDWIGAGAKTAVGFGRFMTLEQIAKKNEEEKLRKKQEQQRKREAEKNWKPSVGEIVVYDDEDVDVEVISITGNEAEVYFINDSETGIVLLSGLKKKT